MTDYRELLESVYRHKWGIAKGKASKAQEISLSMLLDKSTPIFKRSAHPDDFFAVLDEIIRKKWGPIQQDAEGSLKDLVNWLAFIAVEMNVEELSLGKSESRHPKEIKKELRELLEGRRVNQLSSQCRKILGMFDVYNTDEFLALPDRAREAILGPIVDQRKFKQLTEPLHSLVLDEMRSGSISLEPRGRKPAELAHVIIGGLCEAYQKITGSSLATGQRKGLQAACRAIFVILELNKKIDVKNVLENILDNTRG